MFDKYSTPRIINSDQGSQYSCDNWIQCLNSHSVKISMNAKGRALDNIFTERFWRRIKYDYIYINSAKDGLKLYQGIDTYVNKYNCRKHQGINLVKPIKLNVKRKKKLKSA